MKFSFKDNIDSLNRFIQAEKKSYGEPRTMTKDELINKINLFNNGKLQFNNVDEIVDFEKELRYTFGFFFASKKSGKEIMAITMFQYKIGQTIHQSQNRLHYLFNDGHSSGKCQLNNFHKIFFINR